MRVGKSIFGIGPEYGFLHGTAIGNFVHRGTVACNI